jgi:hypothetical protein
MAALRREGFPHAKPGDLRPAAHSLAAAKAHCVFLNHGFRRMNTFHGVDGHSTPVIDLNVGQE